MEFKNFKGRGWLKEHRSLIPCLTIVLMALVLTLPWNIRAATEASSHLNTASTGNEEATDNNLQKFVENTSPDAIWCDCEVIQKKEYIRPNGLPVITLFLQGEILNKEGEGTNGTDYFQVEMLNLDQVVVPGMNRIPEVNYKGIMCFSPKNPTSNLTNFCGPYQRGLGVESSLGKSPRSLTDKNNNKAKQTPPTIEEMGKDRQEFKGNLRKILKEQKEEWKHIHKIEPPNGNGAYDNVEKTQVPTEEVREKPNENQNADIENVVPAENNHVNSPEDEKTENGDNHNDNKENGHENQVETPKESGAGQ